MCDFCKINSGIDYDINLPGMHIMTICPNCISEKIYNKSLIFPIETPHCSYASHLSGKTFGFNISLGQKTTICLTKEEIELFIGHMLMPNQFRVLTNKLGKNIYELHDDFYDEDGFAMQPLDEERYASNLRLYLNNPEQFTTYDNYPISSRRHAEEERKVRHWINMYS